MIRIYEQVSLWIFIRNERNLMCEFLRFACAFKLLQASLAYSHFAFAEIKIRPGMIAVSEAAVLYRYLFIFKIFINTFCCGFSGTHGKNNGGCSGYGIPAGKDTFFCGLTVFFICNDTSVFIDIKSPGG